MAKPITIDARDGNSAFGYYPYSTCGEVAYYLSKLRTGAGIEIEKVINTDGSKCFIRSLRTYVSTIKKRSGREFVTRLDQEKKILRVWRRS